MRTTVAYRHAASAGDGDALVRLCSNESAYGPLPSVVAAIDEATTALHRYPDPACTDLRHDLAARLGAPSDLIHVGPGSGAVLTQLALATVSTGEQIVCPWPSFELYPILAQLADGELVRVPLRHHVADLDAVAERVGPRTRMVLLANPNNPTSTAVELAAVERLLDTMPQHALLVVDEAYADFSADAPQTGLPALVADRANLVVTRTFSKLHGLASLRIGYCVADPAVIASISKLPPPFAVNGLAQAAALASLAAGRELSARRHEMVAQRRRLVAAIRAGGWEVPAPAGNFVWVAAGRRAGALGASLESAGILARVFDGEGVRITVGTAIETTLVVEAFPDQEDL
ncbi:histidinol-phosphate transaminase [soil metagenome]